MRTSGVNAALLRYLPSGPHGQPFGSHLYYDNTGPPGKGMSLCQMTEAETDPEGADSWQGQLHAASLTGSGSPRPPMKGSIEH